MNKDFSQTPRPTFKRALRHISVISVVISMTLVWLLLSTASIFTLKQYAQKNLELTAATMGRSLEACRWISQNPLTSFVTAVHPLCRQGRLARGGITFSEVSDNAVVNTVLCYRDDARVNLGELDAIFTPIKSPA